jgi:hypothetical protein
VALGDESAIGVVAVLGSTFDGSDEPVAELATDARTCWRTDANICSGQTAGKL